ncbi:hypothetical protein CEXT_752611 [Caerostris extrusa]|uniref:Uncharacterized protein n=1 Tax=Caerostris extrusa TaxID=172846 RepID=A0AAV4WJW6_CAEEX|nr:hypothetical protein CEXT_752611 [Caerostris extrusa]
MRTPLDSSAGSRAFCLYVSGHRRHLGHLQLPLRHRLNGPKGVLERLLEFQRHQLVEYRVDGRAQISKSDSGYVSDDGVHHVKQREWALQGHSQPSSAECGRVTSK